MDRGTQVFRSVLKAFIEEARQGMTIEEEHEAIKLIADHFVHVRDSTDWEEIVSEPKLTLVGH